MKVYRVHAESKGEARHWRWLLYADFHPRLGFVPVVPTEEPLRWSEARVAVDELGLVAGFRYDKHADSDEIVAGGTWVRPDQRGKGIAQDLWRRTLRRGVKWVAVTTISAGGRALVRSLRQLHPKVGWNHT